MAGGSSETTWGTSRAAAAVVGGGVCAAAKPDFSSAPEMSLLVAGTGCWSPPTAASRDDELSTTRGESSAFWTCAPGLVPRPWKCCFQKASRCDPSESVVPLLRPHCAHPGSAAAPRLALTIQYPKRRVILTSRSVPA